MESELFGGLAEGGAERPAGRSWLDEGVKVPSDGYGLGGDEDSIATVFQWSMGEAHVLWYRLALAR